MKPAKVLTPASLAETREAMGLSRVELAELMGVSRSSIRHWERPGSIITRVVELAFYAVLQELIARRAAGEAQDGEDA